MLIDMTIILDRNLPLNESERQKINEIINSSNLSYKEKYVNSTEHECIIESDGDGKYAFVGIAKYEDIENESDLNQEKLQHWLEAFNKLSLTIPVENRRAFIDAIELKWNNEKWNMEYSE